MGDRSGPPHVLVVCQANICRSPTAALLLSRALSADRVIDIRTGGCEAVEGAGWCAAMRDRVLPGDDADRLLARHRARSVGDAELAQAHLVLAADRTTRSALARRMTGQGDRLFTLVEAAATAAAVIERAQPPLESLVELVDEMHAVRGTVALPRAHASRWPGRSTPGLDLPDAHDRQLRFNHRRLLGSLQSVTASLAHSLDAAHQHGR